MYEDYYMTAEDVAEALKISKSFAYKVIRDMNREMQKMGYFTVSGRINRQFFLKKTCYGSFKTEE
ncbi:MAG: DNA-binding protein [Clostridia bacterium]|nr:DNA-binding protein [Clostridia bacterium]